MGIEIAQATDLLKGTLAKFDKDMVQIALKNQTCEIVNRWFKSDKKVVTGGDSVKFYVQLKRSNNASHTQLYDTDDVNVAQVVSEGSVNWVHAKTAWAFDVRELAMNKGNPQRVFNMLEQRVKAAIHDLIIELEEAAWRTPSSSSDTLAPHGLPPAHAWRYSPPAEFPISDKFSGSSLMHRGPPQTVSFWCRLVQGYSA